MLWHPGEKDKDTRNSNVFLFQISESEILPAFPGDKVPNHRPVQPHEGAGLCWRSRGWLVGWGEGSAAPHAGWAPRCSLAQRWLRKASPQNQYEPWLSSQLTSVVFHFQRPTGKAGSTGRGRIFNLYYFNWDLGVGKHGLRVWFKANGNHWRNSCWVQCTLNEV